jgi:4-amino-4-deoxy-L-arabinose transferase-like glycosyltransferase
LSIEGELRSISRRFVLWLVIANAVVRGVWIWYMHPPQQADFKWYFTHAVMMANGQGYFWQGHYTAYWPIGWPFVLSLIVRIFGPHMMAGLIANMILSIGIVFLVYKTSMLVFRSHRVAAAAAIGYSLLPSQIEWNGVLGSEELFTFLLVLSIYIYLRSVKRTRRWLVPVMLSGLAMGFASDVRPIAIVFPLFLLLYEWVVQHRGWLGGVKRTATFAVTMFVGIIPVTIRNLIAMHHFVLVSTNGGVNLWQGTKTDGGYFWSWLPWINPLLKAKNNEILEDQIGKQVAIQHILHHPASTLHHGVLKIIDLYKTDVNAVWYTFHVVYQSKTILYVMDTITSAAYWLFMIIAIIGLIRLVVKKTAVWKSAVFPLFFIVYNTGLFVFFPAWDRFRYPLMPLFALYLGYGVTWWWDRRLEHRLSVPHP